MEKSIEQLKIAVLAGGVGSERDVSLHSGQTVYNALLEGGHHAILSDITPEDLSILEDASIDVFFPILHGQFGEDGQLQKMLEDRGLCFTGSDSKSSRNAFNKILSKQAFFHAQLPVAKHVIVHADDTQTDLQSMLSRLADKYVVKPVNQGSSVGVEIVDDSDHAAAKAMDCYKTYGDCMVEEFISGRELTVGILNGAALPVIEIRSQSGFYDYQSKYIDDSTEYLFDTLDDKTLEEKIRQMAVVGFRELECRHMGRVDFILSEQHVPFVLEINTLPGFTSHSLLPMAARKAGISTPALCRQIVAAAWSEFNA